MKFFFKMGNDNGICKYFQELGMLKNGPFSAVLDILNVKNWHVHTKIWVYFGVLCQSSKVSLGSEHAQSTTFSGTSEQRNKLTFLHMSTISNNIF